MKKTALILCAIIALVVRCYASEDDDVMQPAPPPCGWYRAREWSVDLWGASAFSTQQGHQAWGGGADFKYFWSRYLGLGVEGFVLNARDTGGAALGTLTARYPVGCSHFAPYAFAGFGVLAGGSDTERFFADEQARVIGQFGGGMEFRITPSSAMGKITVGVMADFSRNFVGGGGQDFGMTRVGLTLSY